MSVGELQGAALFRPALRIRAPFGARLTARLALLAALPLAAGCGTAEPPRARNVILFIGDGFGMNHLSLGYAAAAELDGRPFQITELGNAGHTGYAMPFSYDRITTDSAAAATQMATGRRALSQTLSVDPETAEPIPTILEWAEERGLATGLVANMSLTHATPAAFKVHARSRYVPESDLADQLFSAPEVEVLLGGGGRAMTPAGSNLSDSISAVPEGVDGESRRTDDRDLIAEAAERGYTVVGDRAELFAARGSPRLLGVFAASHLPYVLDRGYEGLDEAVPTLVELTEAAIASLETADGGFFLMVEGGRIDYAGHDNDAGAMLAEIREFDEAVGAAFDYARGREDTLVLVTGDHGTGGFSFTYGGGGPGPLSDRIGWDYQAGPQMAGRVHLEALAGQRRSLIEAMREVSDPPTPASVLEVIEGATGIRLTDEEAADLAAQLSEERPTPRDFGAYYLDSSSMPVALAARKLGNHTQVVWSTGGHTSEPVLLFGYGPGAEGVGGFDWNTRLHDIIRRALGG